MDYERLGAFYLGTEIDPASHAPTGEVVLYDARDLTTHAVCLGMTGSGKTGLCIALLEEALIDGVPVIAIDPKGDLGNLALTFPGLAPADFAPWMDAAAAQREGLTVEAAAEKTAARWREGLAASGQGPERIARLRDAAEVTIYTPGGDAGRPLSLLASFRAPPRALEGDGEAWRDRVEGAASGLLGLVGIQADPLRSREHVLLSTLLDQAWRAGQDAELAALIRGVVKPPFATVGAFDLETFFPAAERTQLALALNTLLASPSFAAWTRGEPLDVAGLLFTPAGKPRASVLSIAHLGDAERMFFVTLLLQEVVTWMRAQPGTSSLRAVVFMDEVAGYLPPTAMPPSKKPMLTLLKQARAFGVGMVLASQNPVDLDYKALSNAGTWWLGRLQTERDKLRVMEGLEGASAAAGRGFDRAKMEATLAGLGNREFVMQNAHDDDTTLFQSRFVMSYLAGPLARGQIQRLAGASPTATGIPPAPTAAAVGGARPVVPAQLPELFSAGARLSPALFGVAKVHYVDAKAGIDAWREVSVVAPLAPDTAGDFWEHGQAVEPARIAGAATAPAPDATFAALPAALDAKTAARLDEGLAAWILRSAPLTVASVRVLGVTSRPDESGADFAARVALAAREARDAAIEKLRAQYRPKLEALAEKQRVALQKVEKVRAQASHAVADSAIAIGATVLGAMFGTRRSGLGRAATAARSMSRSASKRGDIDRAQATADEVARQRTALEAELAAAVASMQSAPVPPPEVIEVKARKADTTITHIAVYWQPTG